MKRIFFLLSTIFLLNGCVQSVALLGSTAGGASSGRLLQSSLNSTISYGIKQHTGKTPLGHALAYIEKNNPEKKRETCISFIEKTRSEFCTIAKKQISLTNNTIKEKVLETFKKTPKTENPVIVKTSIKPMNKINSKEPNSFTAFNQFKRSPRELAIAFQVELKKLKSKNLGKHLVSR